MILLKHLLNEIFDTARDLLLNPKYDDMTFGDLLNDFREDGGDVIGIGSYGMVLSHPKWKYVLKIFSNDVPYLKFVRFVLQNPRKSFPKFYDKPRKIIPRYKRTRESQFLYVVRMEKLDSINRREFMDIEFYLYYGLLDFSQHPKTHVWTEIRKKIDGLNGKYPGLKTFTEDYHFLVSKASNLGAVDLSQNNIMIRPNGELVLSDPFWEGETPYQRQYKLHKIETDYYGYGDEKDDPMIKGGKKFKQIKPKSINRPKVKDNLPFEEGIEKKYFVDFYNKDGDIFTTVDIRTDHQLPKTIHKMLSFYDPGTITHIVIKNSDYVPLKTITYEEWMKANPVAPKKVDLTT